MSISSPPHASLLWAELIRAGALLFPRLEVALGLLPRSREETNQRAATGHFLLGEFVVERRRQRFFGDRVDNVRRDHNDAVAIADDDVAGIDRDTATGDRQVEIGRLMDDAARRRRRA